MSMMKSIRKTNKQAADNIRAFTADTFKISNVSFLLFSFCVIVIIIIEMLLGATLALAIEGSTHMSPIWVSSAAAFVVVLTGLVWALTLLYATELWKNYTTDDAE